MSQPPSGPSYGQDPSQGPGQPNPGQPYPGQPGGYPPPGQQYGSPGYGGQPAPGPGGGYPAPGAGRGPAPKEVETSFRLWLIYFALGLVASIVSFGTFGSLLDAQLRAQGLDPSELPPEAAGALQVGLVGGVVVGLVFLALIVAAVFQMRKGRNWARIVLAVLGGLSLLSGILGLFGAGTMLAIGGLGVVSVLLSVVQLALLVAAILFMFRGAANSYFATRR